MPLSSTRKNGPKRTFAASPLHYLGQFETQIFDRPSIDLVAQPEHKIELRQGTFAPHCLAHPGHPLVGPVIAEPRVAGRLNVKLVDLQKTKPWISRVVIGRRSDRSLGLVASCVTVVDFL